MAGFLRTTGLCFGLLFPALLGGCASESRPGGAALYDPDSGRLLNSEIRMETFRPGTTRKDVDLRLLRCEGGRVRGVIETRLRRGEAEVSLEDYGSLWREILAGDAMIYDVANPDPTGGYYHVIRLVRGASSHEFSAQDRTVVFGLSTAAIQGRLQVANRVAERIGELVPTERRPAPAVDTAPEAGAESRP